MIVIYCQVDVILTSVGFVSWLKQTVVQFTKMKVVTSRVSRISSGSSCYPLARNRKVHEISGSEVNICMVSQPLLPAGSPCKVDASVPNEIIKAEQFAVEKKIVIVLKVLAQIVWDLSSCKAAGPIDGPLKC